MTFGDKLRTSRKAAGLSQEELAGRLSVSRSAVAKWETGKGMPDISNIKAVAQLLNVSIDYLLDDGTLLDFSVNREPVDLSAYKGRLKKAHAKDALIRQRFREAVIWGLTPRQRLSLPEKIRDEALLLFTSLLPGVGAIDGGSDLVHAFEHLDKAFYLVETEKTQYIVMITDEYMELRQIAHPISERKFEIGSWTFTRAGRAMP